MYISQLTGPFRHASGNALLLTLSYWLEHALPLPCEHNSQPTVPDMAPPALRKAKQ